MEESVLLRCDSCRAVNRVLRKKLREAPRCGRCGAEIKYHRSPLDVTALSFQNEVLSAPGSVLVFFWSPT